MENLDLGPFAPLAGYVSALIATVFFIVVLWSGGKARWTAPEENLPDTAGRIVGVVCAVSVVALWLYARPETLQAVVRIAWAAVGLLVGRLCCTGFSLVSSPTSGKSHWIR
jgi:4-amino-4-deoxy-L-arabinose transferase-like glycosyltransferase